MALYVAQELGLPPQEVGMWHHTNLITAYGYYTNASQKQARHEWVQSNSKNPKKPPKPKSAQIRFLDKYRIQELDKLHAAQKDDDSRLAIFNGK